MKNISRHTGMLEIISRLSNSKNDNPRYLLKVAGFTCRTAVDSSIGYQMSRFNGKRVEATIGMHYGVATLNSVELMQPKLYVATTENGEFLFEHDSAAEFRNTLCDWLESNPSRRIIETDNRRHPAPAFPYTSWRRVFNETRGSIHATLADAIAAKG